MRYTTDGTLLLDSGVPIANADYEQTAQRLADALNAAGSASRDAEVARLRGALAWALGVIYDSLAEECRRADLPFTNGRAVGLVDATGKATA